MGTLHNKKVLVTYTVFWDGLVSCVAAAMDISGIDGGNGVVEKNVVAVMLLYAMHRVIFLDDILFHPFRARKLCWLTLADFG